MADFCDFKKILSYRSVWMALAALWVVYHHISLTPPCAFLQVLKSCGAGGVDIFVFASGLGCYHSLKKTPDTLIFIKKRLIKIVPAYYLCVTPWVIYDGLRLGTTVQGVVATYLGVDSLFGLGLGLWSVLVSVYPDCAWAVYCTVPAGRLPGDKVAPQIIRGCTFLGGCTLEIYAVHAFAFQVFRDALSDDILYGTDKRWLLLSVLSVLFAVLLARVMAQLTAKTQKQPAQQT